MFLVDSHCHIDKINAKKIGKNISEIIEKAKKNQVQYFLCVCTEIKNFHSMTKILKNYKNVFFSCGQHPLYLKNSYDFDLFMQFSKEKKVIAIGETGLDFLKDNNKKVQENSFIEHIDVAKKIKKPIIVHSRYAKKRTIEILKDNQVDKCGGILHCFSEDKKMAKDLLDMGFYISFSGIITFKKNRKIEEVVKYIPKDRILIETDSPFLSPNPVRKEENQPANVRYIAKKISEIRDDDIKDVYYYTSNNFFSLFNMKFP
ncbi:TatD family hydrolase [bacterium endosymbiont of Pedicinus badii]|uniref:TatD family hydrolase n=1 Tax=bacterium endosymbiont of Pedicinus badii TaxID=1719126 RepID=UPI0009BA2442|nr:TatD family hydrolase [bacterium endosymbiont of Pedicinus badii]OQM34369.1 hypothetical protein AOQ89_00550 [bacterium endosymbiont of Pedicinus badii]